jgi:ferric-chelate reductase [NAD(P)H]
LAKTAFKEGVSGCPLIIEHALSVLEAKVINEVDLGTHTVFIGDVLSSETLKAGTPLTYQYYHQVLKGKSSPNAPTYESKK